MFKNLRLPVTLESLELPNQEYDLFLFAQEAPQFLTDLGADYRLFRDDEPTNGLNHNVWRFMRIGGEFNCVPWVYNSLPMAVAQRQRDILSIWMDQCDCDDLLAIFLFADGSTKVARYRFFRERSEGEFWQRSEFKVYDNATVWSLVRYFGTAFGITPFIVASDGELFMQPTWVYERWDTFENAFVKAGRDTSKVKFSD